jgi:hypothetical protein
MIILQLQDRGVSSKSSMNSIQSQPSRTHQKGHRTSSPRYDLGRFNPMQGSKEHLQKHNGTSGDTEEAHTGTLSNSSTGVDSRLGGSSSAVLGTTHTASSGSSRNLGGNGARAVSDGDGGGGRDGVDVGVDGGGVRASSGGGADGGDAV